MYINFVQFTCENGRIVLGIHQHEWNRSFSAEFAGLTNTEFVDRFSALTSAGTTPTSRKRSSEHLEVPSSPSKKLKFIHHGMDELIEKKRVGEYSILFNAYAIQIYLSICYIFCIRAH